MTAQKPSFRQRWRDGWSFVGSIFFYVFVAGLGAYAFGNPALGNMLMWALPAGIVCFGIAHI